MVGQTPQQSEWLWLVSGDLSQQKEFQHQSLFLHLGEVAQKGHTLLVGADGRDAWCAERSLETIRSPLNAILEFLTFEYLHGKQFIRIDWQSQ